MDTWVKLTPSLPFRADHQRLADIFVQKGPYLKMYSTYIRQFDNNVALLDEQCRKNPAFVAVVREFEVNLNNIPLNIRLGTPSHFCRRFDFTLQKGLEKSNTFLSASDTFLREPVTKLAFPPGALLAGLTQ